MKVIKILLSASLFGAVSYSPAAAQNSENDILCNVYGKMGSVLIEVALPRSLQDFVDATTGKSSTLTDEFSSVLLKRLSAEEVTALTRLGDDAALIGEASGNVSVQLLMNGQASGYEEVGSIMTQACQRIGSQRIIDNQRRANSAVTENMGN